MTRWRTRPLAVTVVILAGCVAAGAAILPASAAETLTLDTYAGNVNRIHPGPLTVAGHTTGSPAGESIRVWFAGTIVATTPIGPGGAYTATFDTGPLVDGPYSLSVDVPGAGPVFGTKSAQAELWVDDNPSDIVLSSPTPDQAFGGNDFVTVAGRVADPTRVTEIDVMTDNGKQPASAIPVHEDGTFTTTFASNLLTGGLSNLVVKTSFANCSDWSVCGADAMVPVWGGVPQTLTGTAPTENQVLSGTSAVFQSRVYHRMPDDKVTGLVDGTIPLTYTVVATGTVPTLSGGTETYADWRADLTIPGELPPGPHTLQVTGTLHYATEQTGGLAFTVAAPAAVKTPAVTADAAPLTTGVTVTWHAPAGARYDVRYRSLSATKARSGYTYPASLQNTTLTRKNWPGTDGTTYCFSARAHDTNGQTSAWSPETCTGTPYDDRWLTVSAGAKRRSGTGYYRHTATTLAARGTGKHTGVTANRIGVVATTGPDAGTLTVALAGHTLGTIDLRRSHPGHVTTWLPTITRTGALTLTASRHGTVTIDGILTRRP
jgi:hypothetical protein